MEINLVKLLLSLCLIIPIISFSQTMEIYYHLGYDCSTGINGNKIRAGCVTNERMEYTLNTTGNYLESKQLEVNKNIREYSNGEFAGNLEKDSLSIYPFRKRIKIEDLKELINLISLGKDFSIEKNDTIKSFEKKVISKWNRRTFDLSRIDIRKIKRKVKSEFDYNIQDSVLQIISKYVENENNPFMVSSVTEFLTIKFNYEGREFSISQNNLGKVNVSWQIEIDKELFYIISPETNKIISSFLPRKM